MTTACVWLPRTMPPYRREKAIGPIRRRGSRVAPQWPHAVSPNVTFQHASNATDQPIGRRIRHPPASPVNTSPGPHRRLGHVRAGRVPDRGPSSAAVAERDQRLPFASYSSDHHGGILACHGYQTSGLPIQLCESRGGTLNAPLSCGRAFATACVKSSARSHSTSSLLRPIEDLRLRRR